MPERLHKFLAQHGFGSRRELELWMTDGRISLNGKSAVPGDRYTPGDRVIIDGKDVTARLRASAAPQVILYHKPAGQPLKRTDDEPVVSAEDSGTVFDHLPAIRGSRWLAINRMHAGDSGLLLLTTDGNLADALMRRATQVRTVFSVRTLGAPDRDVTMLRTNVQFQDEQVEFESIEEGGGEGANRWFQVTAARADRRAAVRALFESQGFTVSRVIQLSYGPIELPRDLPRGRHRALGDEAVGKLYALAGITVPQPASNALPPHIRPPKKSGDRGSRAAERKGASPKAFSKGPARRTRTR